MLINRIFNGNDAVYGLTVNAVDEAVKEHGADKPVGLSPYGILPAMLLRSNRRKGQNIGRIKRGPGRCKDTS